MENSKEAGPHRRSATRLRGYDYSNPGIYFITVCTAGRRAAFGQVLNAQIQLNAAGRIVAAVWNGLPGHYPGLGIDAPVVMPNHVHGIIVLPNSGRHSPPVGARSPRPNFAHDDRTSAPGGETPPLRTALGRAVAFFKYESTKRISALRGTPGAALWQRGYYDHIVRRGDSLDRIRRHIDENPIRWAFDPENPQAAHPDPEDPWARP